MTLQDNCEQCGKDFKFGWNYCPGCGRKRGFKPSLPKPFLIHPAHDTEIQILMEAFNELLKYLKHTSTETGH